MKAFILANVLLLMAFTLTASQYKPISEGTVLWMNQMVNGDYVLVTHTTDDFYTYNFVKVTFMDKEEGYTTLSNLLPGTPTSFTISGCGHYIVIAATIKDDKTVYTSQVEIPGTLVCNITNPTYIPIVIGE
jgi:predicted pyridoxine 5'-phosphate oxidase superfamily flavin-nucleotide-binding protein